ncbi:MAG TPA: hypothetical protein VF516_17770, partial [Kofleriaceae bacterium]
MDITTERPAVEAAAPGPAASPAVADRHREKVARIGEQLRALPPGRPVSLRKASVSHQVPKRN